MQALLEHFITQSTLYSLIAVLLVAFLESLALVGLILPGTVLMAGLGALIGSGELNFWHAWLVGIIGCLMGDWISFWLGWRFKKPLHRWSFMKKNKSLLDEPFSALDPALRQEMLTLVSDICRERQLTLLMVSHSVEDAARIAPRSIVVADGRIAWQGKTDELLSGQASASALLGIKSHIL